MEGAMSIKRYFEVRRQINRAEIRKLLDDDIYGY